ncbi:MAG: SufE family protein [Candidatus Neomarinimicrobiota bacterium]|tara:strand:- start:2550 stop:2975 length:426 start_codon:yes stop_codon:yes gene_type:complete
MDKIQNNLLDIRDGFSILDGQDKLIYLIDLGKKLDLISESDCTENNKIHACNSQTWVKIIFDNDIVSIKATSESAVVKGLLKILQIAFNNSEKNSIINFINSFDDCNSLFEWLNIGPSISSQRQNGFIGSLEHIKRELNNA